MTPVGEPAPAAATGSSRAPVDRRLAPGSVVVVVVTWRRRALLGVLLAALAARAVRSTT